MDRSETAPDTLSQNSELGECHSHHPEGLGSYSNPPGRGLLALDGDFLVDFGTLPERPGRVPEIRWPDGDRTSAVRQ